MKVLSVSGAKNISDIVYNLLERVGRKRKYEVEEGTKSKTFYLHESKKGRKKNTSESELGFNNDSQVFNSIGGQQYYKL